MKKSTNKLRLELEAIQEFHLQLNSFFWGDFLRAIKKDSVKTTEMYSPTGDLLPVSDVLPEGVNYPLMCCYYPNGSMLKTQLLIPITIIIADKIFKDWSNLNDVESDTLQICRDIYKVMSSSPRWQRIGRIEGFTNITKFIDKSADETAGHTMIVQFRLRDSDSICDIPMPGYNMDESDIIIPVIS